MVERSVVLGELERVIRDRRAQAPDASYTARLLDGGIAAIGAKIVEEAAELVAAARDGEGHDATVHEAADLLYHVLVLLGHEDVALDDVLAELERRRTRSGMSR